MQNLEQILKKHGLRNTPFRTQVLDVFQNNTHALSPSDIEEDLADFDRITLYRTLKSFEEKGIIHKIADHSGVLKYALCESDCNEAHHHDQHVHFHCESCARSFCMDIVTVPKVTIPEGYSVVSRDMLLKGICKECNQRSKN
ncbi:MAG: transcriptional repressor [Saprospiraceae bacterium]